MIQKALRHLLLFVLVALGATSGSWAQGITTAAMNGVVTDGKGQPLPGATVVATHLPTGATYGVGTNADGRFNLQNMRIGGPYTVKVSFVGYTDVTRNNIVLSLGDNKRVDVALNEATTEIGEVTVTGRRDPVINAGRTGSATSVQREQLERLPSLSRSFADFTRITPEANGLNFAGRNSAFNNFTVDGAIFNNAFGLSGTIGGQANAQPISLDAIEQIQVSLAPYDVRQGSFTGAGINAVTRSGTNDFSASIYTFQRRNSLVAGRVRDIIQPFPDFSLNQIGARVGGPIVRNKLFFFVSVETERRADPSSTFVANRPGLPAPGPLSNTSNADAAQLDALSSFLQRTYNYNPGAYENFSLATYSDKLSAKLDWNVNPKNTFSFKFQYLKSYRDVAPSNSVTPQITGGRAPSTNALPFFGAYYRINNNLTSYIGELNSTISNRVSNQFQAGYTGLRDFRESLGSSPFPFVDILYNASGPGQSGTSFTSFGFEPFSANNLLDTDIYQLSDNLSYTAGNHVITLGTYNQLYRFRNGFAPDLYGRYRFNSLTDFYNAAGFNYDPNTLAITSRPGGALNTAVANFSDSYVANADGGNPNLAFPFARVNALQLGFYAQDEWTVKPNFRLTTGLRVDVPIILDSDLRRNNTVANARFRDGYQILTDQVQRTSYLFSPRVGFNWDVNNDAKTQFRGGTGIFTGLIPFVWISNQASNNGLLFGSQSLAGGPNVAFTPDINYTAGANAQVVPATFNLAVTDNNFKFPQVWRTNLGFDQRLAEGLTFTFDAIFTKDINAVYFDNVNLPNPSAVAAGPDPRPLYRNPANLGAAPTSPFFQVNNFIVSNNGAIVMRNTNKGYSYTLTPQLLKTFSNGFAASLAYTYTDSRDVGISGSTPFTLWSARPISSDPNANVLGYSDFLRSHRVSASLSYRKEYLKHLGTTFSAFLDLGPNNRFSYTYNGDINGDGVSTNDLMYIPRDRSEILLTNQTLFNNTPQQTIYTADQQWIDLDNYIKQDRYLSQRRGQVAERNGAQTPWVGIVDARILQDIFTNIGKNRNTLQFSIDVFNLGNLLNANWGVIQTFQRATLLNYTGFDQASGRPTFQFQPIVQTRTVFPAGSTTPAAGTVLTNVQPLTTTERYVTTEGSRYRIQLGLRYIFN